MVTMMLMTLRKQRIPIGIFIFFSGFYLFTAQGMILSGDGTTNFFTIRALSETHSFLLSDNDCDTMERFVQVHPEGQCYGKYDVGLALSGLPLYIFGRSLSQGNPYERVSLPRLFVSTFNQFITAATCSVLYLLAYELSGSRRRALELAILYGLTTLAWPYASTYFSQPLVGLMLLTAVLLLRVGKNIYFILGAGIALGWAILTRLDTLPLVFAIYIYAYYQFQRLKMSRYNLLSRFILLTVTFTFTIMLFLLFNQLRGGSLLLDSYAGEGWTGDFREGSYGLLFSTRRGILFYSPLVILAIPGLVSLWRKGWQAETALIVALFMIQIFIYASWWVWDGGRVWGPRFLVSTHPFLILGVLPWLARDRHKKLVYIFATTGFVIQVIGVTTSPLAYLTRPDFIYTQESVSLAIFWQARDLFDKQVLSLIPNQAHGVLNYEQTILWALVATSLMFIGGFLFTIKFPERGLD